jgi:hypothetical protein
MMTHCCQGGIVPPDYVPAGLTRLLLCACGLQELACALPGGCLYLPVRVQAAGADQRALVTGTAELQD